MKKLLLLGVIAFATLYVGALSAQDVTGIWQGTLKLNGDRELRIEIKVSKTDAGLKTTMYSIDQGAQGTSATTTLQGGIFKYAIPGMDGVYEGKVGSDGMTMTGMWTQGGSALPLDLKHVTPETAWPIPEPPAKLPPMAADANPTFEVATIKPTKLDHPGKYFSVRGRRFTTYNTNLVDLINFSYGLHAKQIVGLPPWAATDGFDIAAQPDGEGQPSDAQWKTMVQKLITERFKLTFHREKRELSVYAVVVSKTGAKLTKSEGDPSGLPANFFRGLGQMTNRNSSIADFARTMQAAVLDRPVVDQTKLEGRYDFTLNWTPDESQFSAMGVKVPPPGDKADAPPSLFTAIQEQLGLRLDSTKAPVDVLVIDHAEKPSEN